MDCVLNIFTLIRYQFTQFRNDYSHKKAFIMTSDYISLLFIFIINKLGSLLRANFLHYKWYKILSLNGKILTSPLQNFLFSTLFETLKFEILHISSNRSELFSIQRDPKYVLRLELFVKDEIYSDFYVVLYTFELSFKKIIQTFWVQKTVKIAEAKHCVRLPSLYVCCLISTTISGFCVQTSVIVHEAWKSQAGYNCVQHFS